MDTDTLQAILAVIGFGLVAKTIRWQIGFCFLDSVRLGENADKMFVAGVILIAQNFLL